MPLKKRFRVKNPLKSKLAKYILDTEIDLLLRSHGQLLFRILVTLCLFSLATSVAGINDKFQNSNEVIIRY